MNLMTILRVLLVFILLKTAATWAQTLDPGKVDISIDHIRGPVYMIISEDSNSGNIGVSVGNDGTFIIDDQFAPLAPKILDTIHTLSDDPIRFIINTHWHNDHTGGNIPIVEAEDSTIIAHKNTRDHLSRDYDTKLWGLIKAQEKPAWPVITFSEHSSLHLNGEEARLVFIPEAHTDGDVIVWFRESNVIHAGDIFTDAYPYIDWSSGGSIDGFLAGYDQLLNLMDKETLIIRGHGPIGRQQDVLELQQIVKEIRDRVARMLEDGKTEEEVVAAHPSQEWDKSLDSWFINGEFFVRTVYQSLTSSSPHLHP